MDLKTFRPKLIKNRFSKITSFVLAALTVVFLILGLVLLGGNKDEAVNLADNREKAGTYAYVDIIAFDEWACKHLDETYYVLYDGTGNVYMSVLSDRAVKKMIRNSTEDKEYSTFVFDEPQRLYGLVKRVDRSVMSMVEQVYSLASGEYLDYFGYCYINTTESPESNTAWMWLTFAMFSGMFTLIFGIIWIGSQRPFDRETRDYTDEEFAEAARMMDEADKKQYLILGEKYLICRGTGALVRYEDILWVHLVDTYYNGVRMGLMLRIHTNHRNSFKIAPAARNTEESLVELMNTIVEKNPEVLVGYNMENKRQYDSLTK